MSSICPQEAFGEPKNPYKSRLFRIPWVIPTRSWGVLLKQFCLASITQVLLGILIIHIIIAIRRTIIKILSVVINSIGRGSSTHRGYLAAVASFFDSRYIQFCLPRHIFRQTGQGIPSCQVHSSPVQLFLQASGAGEVFQAPPGGYLSVHSSSQIFSVLSSSRSYTS